MKWMLSYLTFMLCATLAPAQCNGAFPPNNTASHTPTNYPPASGSEPAVGGTYTDPWTQCVSTRIGNGILNNNSTTNGEMTQYSNVVDISYDDTMVLTKSGGNNRVINLINGTRITNTSAFPVGGRMDGTSTWAGPSGSANGYVDDGHTIFVLVSQPQDISNPENLSASVDNVTTTIPLVGALGNTNIVVGSTVQVDDEQMTIVTNNAPGGCASNNSCSVVVTRGVNGTTAVSHANYAYMQLTSSCRAIGSKVSTCSFNIVKLTLPSNTGGCAPNCTFTQSNVMNVTSSFNTKGISGISTGFLSWGDEGGGLSPDFNHIVLLGSVGAYGDRTMLCSFQISPPSVVGCTDLSNFPNRNNAMYVGKSNRIAVQTCMGPENVCTTDSQREVELFVANLSSHTVITDATNVHSDYMTAPDGHEYGYYMSTKTNTACSPSPKGIYRILVDPPYTQVCTLKQPNNNVGANISSGGNGASGWTLVTEYTVSGAGGPANCNVTNGTILSSYPLAGNAAVINGTNIDCTAVASWTTYWTEYMNELVVASWDGSQIYRVNNPRAFGCSVGGSCSSYYSVPFGNLSRSGKMIAYNTDFGQCVGTTTTPPSCNPNAGYSDQWVTTNPGYSAVNPNIQGVFHSSGVAHMTGVFE